MKNLLKFGIASPVLALVITAFALGVSSQTASAEISSACRAKQVGAFTITNNKLSGTFTVPEGCGIQPVSLMVYLTHASTSPLTSQKMFSYSYSTYPAGTYSVTTTLPDECYFQADFFQSTPILQLENRDYADIIFGAILGGSKDCITPPVTNPPVTPPANTNNNTNNNTNTNTNNNTNTNTNHNVNNVTLAGSTSSNSSSSATTAGSSSAATSSSGQVAGAQSYTSTAGKPAFLPVTGPSGIASIVAGVSLTSGLGYSIVSRLRSRG